MPSAFQSLAALPCSDFIFWLFAALLFGGLMYMLVNSCNAANAYNTYLMNRTLELPPPPPKPNGTNQAECEAWAKRFKAYQAKYPL